MVYTIHYTFIALYKSYYDDSRLSTFQYFNFTIKTKKLEFKVKELRITRKYKNYISLKIYIQGDPKNRLESA